jgi:hypothetical protein
MLTSNENGLSSFVVSRRAIQTKGDIHFKCNRDSGNSYLVSGEDNKVYLGSISAGNVLTVTIVTKGIKCKTSIIPYELDGICFRGHQLMGKALTTERAERGDYVKLASLDGSVWHVVEAVGEWFKEGLGGYNINRHTD